MFTLIYLLCFYKGFEELMRVYTKAYTTVILKEEGGTHPRFYIRCLVEMEDFIHEVWEDRESRYKSSYYE